MWILDWSKRKDKDQGAQLENYYSSLVKKLGHH